MSILISATQITSLHHDAIIRWKKNTVQLKHDDFFKLVEENHAFNFQLWHAEDRARREDMGYEFVYRAKREIDFCNQQRNNRMETIDEWLYTVLQPSTSNDCPVHTETPGMIIDRLSILSLKAYHMGQQVQRPNVSEAHQQECRQKHNTIVMQLEQLSTCLQEFLDNIQEKTRTFRLYHQFKMYNDPNLNPELYQPS
ncbi:MAG: DUF4254 domain-containing protein [Legionella sp.]